MKAIRLFSPNNIANKPLRQVEMERPDPKAGQMRLKVEYCGVCHTDLHTAEGDIHPSKLPITPGHQIVGRVDTTGPGTSRFKPGDRVGIPWLYQACGRCEYCQRGEENLCPNAKFTGFDVDGGFAEYMIAEEKYTLPLPDTISGEQAAPLLCAGIIGYRSLRRADLKAGQRLGLFGFGASAHLAIQVARYWNCEVYVFTRSAQHQHHAEDLGAAWTGSAEETPPHALDCAITFAPAGELIPLALQNLRPGGTLAINAIHLSPIPEMPYSLIYGERTLRSVANATYQDGLDFLQLAAEIPIHCTTTLYPFEHVNEALLDLKHSRINGEAVLKI